MRIISVLGIVAVGIGIGTTAVLAPLAIPVGTPDAGSLSAWLSAAWTRPAQTGSQIAESARRQASADANPPTLARAESGGRDRRDAAQIHALSADATARTVDAPAQAKPRTLGADARGIDTPWTTAVVVEADHGPRVGKVTSSKPASEGQRRDLVRDIQRELKRVGCYDGEADGQWRGATKRAMGEFTDRVNASLPYEEPDLILLTLVQGERGSACGKSCPAGQGLNDSGRCTPNSVLAHPDHGRGDIVVSVRTRPPRPANAPAVGTAWNTTTVRTPVETGLSPAAVTARNTAVAAATSDDSSRVIDSRPPPLPGRMAIGAPMTIGRLLETNAATTPPTEPLRTLSPGAQLANATPGTLAPDRDTAPVGEPLMVSKVDAAASGSTPFGVTSSRAPGQTALVNRSAARHVPSIPVGVRHTPESTYVPPPPSPIMGMAKPKRFASEGY